MVASDGTNTSTVHQITVSVAAPAGIAGSPINLGLIDPSGGGSPITVTVGNLPAGWTLDGTTQLADGSWEVTTANLGALTATTLASFAGAVVLDMQLSWTGADGTLQTMMVANNLEAYAPGSPIFAWSGSDVLTGSGVNDLFVFSQPVGADIVHQFDAAHDQIDLIGYAGVSNFADLAGQIANDSDGNALISLGAGQSITLIGTEASALTADDFVFNQQAVLTNAGAVTIADGALLPLSGVMNNTGIIELASSGNTALLQIIQNGLTLEGGGQIKLSDSDANVISGTSPDASLTNLDNTISGAGQLGGGELKLINAGTIIADGTHALIIDTGANAVVNAGTLEATGSGGLIVNSSVDNAGTIWANGGNVDLTGAVSGSGTALISGTATLELGAAATLNVSLAVDASGTLILDDAAEFHGTISGFDGNDWLKLQGLGVAGVNDAASFYAQGGSIVDDGAGNATIHIDDVSITVLGVDAATLGGHVEFG